MGYFNLHAHTRGIYVHNYQYLRYTLYTLHVVYVESSFASLHNVPMCSNNNRDTKLKFCLFVNVMHTQKLCRLFALANSIAIPNGNQIVSLTFEEYKELNKKAGLPKKGCIKGACE